MRSLPANSTLVAISRILSTFSKVLITNKLIKLPYFAHYKNGGLTKNSLENFWSNHRFHHLRKAFSSSKITFLRTTTSVFDRFISLFWMKQLSFISFCPRFSLYNESLGRQTFVGFSYQQKEYFPNLIYSFPSVTSRPHEPSNRG